MIKFILDLLFPIHCLGCNQEIQNFFICPVCFEKIPLDKKALLKFDSKSDLTYLITTSYYNYPLIKQAVYKYKYDFVKDLSKPLGQLMVNRLNFINKTNTEEFPLLSKDALLIPVPLHKKRLRWRGFNQAELLAVEIGKQLNIPVVNDLLIRTKYAAPQVKIKTPSERQQNIKHAFALSSNQRPQFTNKTLILIDDICTTGATLKECAKILKTLKPKEIWGLIIARG